MAVAPLHASANKPTTVSLHGFATLTSPPFAWVDACTGQLTGSSAHILKKAFKEHNAELIIEQPLPPFSNQWQVKGRRLIAGDLDIFYGNNMNIYTIDKSLLSHNPIPATIIEGGLFSLKKNNIKVSTIKQTKDKTIGMPTVLKSFITATGLPKDIFDNTNIIDKLETKEAINMLIEGDIDYIIGGKYRYNSIAREMKKNTQMEFSPIDNLSRNLYFWHRTDHKNSHLFDKVIATLEQYRQIGYVEYMNKTYFLNWNNQPDCETRDKP
ncbi:hypothetical protein BST96_09115 [Oceanicoccus sagamiensis]|uniref:Uncharacterized protein n=1 Tax=Oceanicoccus sagamiensis TaxID=716816 RepID=A0A1X9N9C5_9GAMM|nr:hypothetical protein BST96_09115 [Oceanicoccus sagamiensis]